MLITRDFVFLSYPKTGSNFFKHIVKQIYSDVAELLFPVNCDNLSRDQLSPHGSVSQIPEEFRNRQIVSITRNPFDRYVSSYFFKWYLSHPSAEPKVLKEVFPDYPEIRFEEYLKMIDRYGKYNILNKFGIDVPTEVGFQTIQFFSFYSYDQKAALSALVNDRGDEYQDFPRVTFMHQESLNADLYRFFRDENIPESKLNFILNEPRINATPQRPSKDWRSYWTDLLFNEYKKKEAVLLNRFPEYDCDHIACPDL